MKCKLYECELLDIIFIYLRKTCQLWQAVISTSID